MKLSPAKRIKVIRELMGFTRQKFGDSVGIDYLRLSTLENDRGRMSVDDLAAIDEVFPEFTRYLMHGKTLDLATLEKSENELIRNAATRVKNGEIPEGYGLEEVIVDGSQRQ